MPVLQVTRELCVNGWLVPAERVESEVMDPHNLANEAEDAKHKVNLVDLKVSAPHTWLYKSLGLHPKWFTKNHGRIPLLREILEAIRSPKRKRGGEARQPTRRSDLVILQVRDRVLWAQNESRYLRLAVRDGEKGIEDLHWFMQELSQDVGDLQEADELMDESLHKERRLGIPDDLQEHVREALHALQEHPRFASAHFQPSKSAMHVVRSVDGATKRLTVKKLKKARGNDDGVSRQFALMQAAAIEFLEGEEPEADNADSDGVSDEHDVPKNFAGRQEPAAQAQELAEEPAAVAPDDAEPAALVA